MARPEDPPFIARRCIDCDELLPAHHFLKLYRGRMRKARRCHRCRRNRSATAKRQRYQSDDTWREHALATARRNRPNASEDARIRALINASKNKWAGREVRDFAAAADGAVIVYAVPDHEPALPRNWWTGYRLIVRGERPGMVAPRGIPVATIRRRIVDVHPACPDRWTWCAAKIENWIKRYA